MDFKLTNGRLLSAAQSVRLTNLSETDRQAFIERIAKDLRDREAKRGRYSVYARRDH